MPVLLAACSKEARPVGPALPMTAPASAIDPRISLYQDNAFQVAQGGRYYGWYGCGGCHGSGSGGSGGSGGAAANGPDLGLGRWQHGGGFDAVYAFIARGHAAEPSARQDGAASANGPQIPAEQLWQITAYVRTLPTLDAQKRRRQDLDAVAEPRGRRGPAPLRKPQ